MRAKRILSLAAFAAALCWTANVYAQTAAATGAQLPVAFWAGAALTIGLAIVTGYARGIDKRVSMVEYDNRNLQSQISGVREMVRSEYHPKSEIADQLDDIKASVASLHRRFDYFSAGASGRPFPDG